MRRYKVTIFAVAALALLLGTGAMAADPTVVSVLAIEYNNGVFTAAVLARGPEPLVFADLFVNDVQVTDAKESQVVLLPARNLTLFKFTLPGPGAVIKPGDSVRAVVTDSEGNEAEKTVACIQGRFFRQLVVCR